MNPDVSFNNIIHNISKLCSWNGMCILLHNIMFKGPVKLSVTTKGQFIFPGIKIDSQDRIYNFEKGVLIIIINKSVQLRAIVVFTHFSSIA